MKKTFYVMVMKMCCENVLQKLLKYWLAHKLVQRARFLSLLSCYFGTASCTDATSGTIVNSMQQQQHAVAKSYLLISGILTLMLYN